MPLRSMRSRIQAGVDRAKEGDLVLVSPGDRQVITTAAGPRERNPFLDPVIDALAGSALDPDGVPSFQRLQPRMHVSDESTVRKLRKSTPVVYQVFDMLYADGEMRGFSNLASGWESSFVESTRHHIDALLAGAPPVLTGEPLTHPQWVLRMWFPSWI